MSFVCVYSARHANDQDVIPLTKFLNQCIYLAFLTVPRFTRISMRRDSIYYLHKGYRLSWAHTNGLCSALETVSRDCQGRVLNSTSLLTSCYRDTRHRNWFRLNLICQLVMTCTYNFAILSTLGITSARTTSTHTTHTLMAIIYDAVHPHTTHTADRLQ